MHCNRDSGIRQASCQNLVRRTCRWTVEVCSLSVACVFLQCLLVIVMGGAAHSEESIQRDSIFAGREVIPSVTWKETSSEERWRILALINDHMQSNYARIQTWKGVYRVRTIEGQAPAFLKESFGDRLASRDVSKVGLESSFHLRFAIDLPGQRIYRAKKTDLMYWRDLKSDEQFHIPDTGPSDENSFVAGEEYVHFDPVAVWPEFTYLLNNPDAQRKRAAFREPAEAGKRKHYADMLDPRDFFSYSQGVPVWGLLSSFLDAHHGKLGGETKRIAEQTLKVFDAEVGDDKIYRLDSEARSSRPDIPVFYTSWVFDGKAGFHPTGFVTREGTDKKMQEIQWRWKTVDGIFLPEAVLESFTATFSQSMQLWRESELVECSANVPLDADQFTLRGLGLEEGELVIDKIDRAVNIFRDGKTVRLGAFGDQYVAAPPQTLRQSPTRMILIGLNLLLFIGALYWVIRRRKRGGERADVPA